MPVSSLSRIWWATSVSKPLLLRSTCLDAIVPTRMLSPATTKDERIAKATVSFSRSEGR